MVGVDGVGLQVAEASPQPFLDANDGEEVLKENEARVRCQVLPLESEFHTRFGFTSNVGFAKFHSRGLRCAWYVLFWRTLVYQPRRPHSSFHIIFTR